MSIMLNIEDELKRLKVDELTPVELHNGIYFKRDDLYEPFSDIPLSGGKVRQAISLILENYESIVTNYERHIVTGSSVTSPQGIIVTRVAKEFGLDCCTYLGAASPNSVKSNNILMNILYQGGKLNFETRIGYDSAINSTIQKKRLEGKKFFQVRFGINLEDNPKSILESVGSQVQNLPKDLDYLIIPCGSCITMSGIIKGLVIHGVHPKHVVGIQIAGYDRTQTIKKILGVDTREYELRLSRDYPYSRKVQCSVDGMRLDPLYEAKAFDYMMKYMSDEIKDKKVCFWVVGDSNLVREHVYLV